MMNPPSTSSEFHRALPRALRYLSRYAVTRWELYRWLRRKNVPPPAARRVVKYCRKRHYLDDRVVLHGRIVRARRRGWGPRRIYAALRQRGIPHRWAERAVRAWYPPAAERKVFARWLRRLPPGLDRPTLVRKARARGFDPDLIARCWEVYRHEQS